MNAFDSPFKPGARVAVRIAYSDAYIEQFVDRAYKTGNFTLKGSKQQWRPSYSKDFQTGRIRWSAYETGSGFGRRVLVLWDAHTDAELSEKIAATKRHDRWITLRQQFDRIRRDDLSDTMLDAIERAIQHEQQST